MHYAAQLTSGSPLHYTLYFRLQSTFVSREQHIYPLSQPAKNTIFASLKIEKAVFCLGGCCNIIAGHASQMQSVQLESRSSTITSNSPPPSASVHSTQSTLYRHYLDQRTPLSPTTHQPASNTFHYAHYYVTLHMSHIPFRLHCLRPVGRVMILLDLGRWDLVVLHGVAGG